MESLSFDSFTKLYDATRTFNEEALNKCFSFLVTQFPPERYQKVFEPGIGNGRIASRLETLRYEVVGIDISIVMLLDQSKRHFGINAAQADSVCLPFPNDCFELCIAVHLFYFIHDWRTAINELLRVVKSCGAIVLMHTGTGQEIPHLNQRYKELCDQEGFSIKSVGVSSTGEVLDYFNSLGYTNETIKDVWQWDEKIVLRKAVEYMQERAYSFTGQVPEKVHSKVIARLKAEILEEFGSLDYAVSIPNQIYLNIIRM